MQNIDRRYWHNRYESLSPTARAVIDEAFGEVKRVFTDANLSPRMDDSAEELVADLTRYAIGSAR